MRQQAEFYQSLPQAAVAATQARLAQGANSDGTVAVKVTASWHAALLLQPDPGYH